MSEFADGQIKVKNQKIKNDHLLLRIEGYHDVLLVGGELELGHPGVLHNMARHYHPARASTDVNHDQTFINISAIIEMFAKIITSVIPPPYLYTY